MKWYLLFLWFLLFVSTLSNAQICKGKVVDMETGEPVLYANVFLEGSAIGTLTDSTGNFTLDTKGFSSLPLIVSLIGYETNKFPKNYISENLIIYLKKGVEIGEIKVRPDTKDRKKYIKQFKHEFLGTTGNALRCEILNEEDLIPFYNQETSTLHVNSSKPLLIRNKALGYQVLYFLESFKHSGDRLSFSGYCLFEAFEFDKKAEQNKAEQKRKLAYADSRLFFLRCLYRGSLDYNGYKMFDPTNNPIEEKDIVFDLGNDQKEICFDKIIRIDSGDPQSTYLLIKDECSTVEKNGYYDPSSISWLGTMSRYRIGDLLPFDYEN